MKNTFLLVKRFLFFIMLAILQFFLSGNSKHQEKIHKRTPEERRWTGTITFEQRYSGITGTSERHVTVSFNNAWPTLHRDNVTTTELNFTDDKGTGSETFHSETIIGGKKFGMSDCQGSGQTELHIVDIDDESYYIHAIGPSCTGTDVNLINGITTTVEPYTTDITITEPLGIRRDILSGSKTETKDMGGDIGTVTTSITWHLVRNYIEPCVACGSVIRIENQSLGQSIAIAGTPFTLNYRSDRIFGSNGSDGLGGWTLSPQHRLWGNRIYFGNGQEFVTKQDLRAATEEIPGIIPVGGYLVASADGDEMYAFDGGGNHLRSFDAVTGTLIYQFQYDIKKRLTAVLDAYGQATTIEQNTTGLPIAIISPNRHRTNLEFDKTNNLASITNPLGEKNSFTYSVSRLLSSMVDPRGFSHTYDYDAAGRLLRGIDPSGGFTKLDPVASTNDYIVNVTTASGRNTKYRTINKPGGISERIVIFPDGSNNTETKWPDGREELKYANGTLEMQTAQSILTGGHRSPLPDLVTVTLSGGLVSTTAAKRTISLANTMNPLSITSLVDNVDRNGAVAKSIYTGATRTLKELSPSGRLRTTMFDKYGKIIKREIEGLSPLTFSYDSYGRLVLSREEIETETRKFSYTYDGAGNLETITDPLGRISSFRYDATGQNTQIALPGGSTIAFTYDAAGNITDLKPPGRPSHQFEYNALGLMIKYIPPGLVNGSAATTYKYDTDKQLTDVIRPDGKTISLSYDVGCACGKLSRREEPRGVYNYTYDKKTGLLNSLSSPDGVVLNFAYNGGLPITEIWAGPIRGKVQAEYDRNFRVVSRKVNDAMQIIYKTDSDGLLVKAGDMLLVRNPLNGYITSTKLEKITETIGYNDFAKKTSSVVSFGNTSNYDAQYKYDKLGRVVSKIETIGGVTDNWEYGYDQAGRLASVINGKKITKYNYDENGNRLAFVIDDKLITATYDEQDRLLRYGNNVYSYTANGDLLRKSDGTITNKYNYDVFGNLISVELPDSRVINYIIDGNGRRIGRKVNGILQKGFLYQDELRIVSELDNKNNVKSRFVYASRMYVPDFMIRDGITYRIISDNTGSPRLVIDVIKGSVAQRMNYDEFGNVIEDSNPGFQPFGFAGGLYDPDTKLTRFGARDYDASIGRWTAKDPILFGSYQTNLYSYVANDPLNQKDPTGQGVRVCHQTLLTVEFPKGLSHWWLETSTVKQGMGQNPKYGPLTANVSWVDQSYKYSFKGEKIICEDYPTVDEECVNANTIGDLGFYFPKINDCQVVVKDVLEKCDRAPKPPPTPQPQRSHFGHARWQ